jgi:heavy metal sensor kinase
LTFVPPMAVPGRRRGLSLESIRVSLALWYVGVLALILGVFGGVLYTSVGAGLERYINKTLVLQAAGIASSLSSFWEAERASPGLGPGNWQAAPSDRLAQVVDAGRLPELVARWAGKTKRLNAVHPIRLLDRAGRPLAETTGFARLGLPVTEAAIAQAKQGQDLYETLALEHERVRLFTYPVVDGERVLYTVQVATSLSQADESRLGLRLWLLWLIPSTILITGTVGWFLASRALRPLGRMIRQAQEIGVQRLDDRLDVPRTGDELEQLGVTFNELLARLARAFRRLRQFSAAASHELRTPLTVMRGELEVTLRKPRDLEEYRRVLRTHLETVNDMTHTVSELLALARSEAIEEAIEWRPVNLHDLVQQAQDVWRPLAKKKSVRMEVPGREPVWVRGERVLLERLVSNLLDNAIRHTPANGLVTVRSECCGQEARLTVADTGSGIPPEELPQIFDRFFKRRVADDQGPSTGLGLGLCRWIVEAHHGRIEVASQPERGAIFTVWLPLLPRNESPGFTNLPAASL